MARRELIDLSPVRQYSRPNASVQRAFIREAASSSPGLEQYVNSLLNELLRVHGADELKKAELHNLSELIDEEQALMDRELMADYDRVLDFVSKNPAVLAFPLKSFSKDKSSRVPFYQFLVLALQSIAKNVLVDSIKGLSVEDLRKREQAKAASSWEHPTLTPAEYGNPKLPFPAVAPYTFQYLDTALSAWGEQDSSGFNPTAFGNYMGENPPRSDSLDRGEVIKIFSNSTNLPFVVVNPFLKKLSPEHNVLSVATAVLDSAIAKNAVQWWVQTGRHIDWKQKFSADVDDDTYAPEETQSPATQDMTPPKVIKTAPKDAPPPPAGDTVVLRKN